MRKTFVAAIIVVAALVGSQLPLLASEPLRILGPAERRAYHACLVSAWVQDYCRYHVFGYLLDYDLGYRECVIANRPRKYSAYDGTYWGYNVFTRDECWRQAQGLRR